MVTMNSPDESLACETGSLVYAHVDQATLAVLDRSADQQVLPRSWLITEILQDWARQQTQPQDEPLAA
jgi:hypothetical protein